jgi:hypothetical protein
LRTFLALATVSSTFEEPNNRNEKRHEQETENRFDLAREIELSPEE